MEKFVVKIELSTFFDDERKLVHILVDPKWQNVQCLQRRVEKVFDVSEVRFLSNEGCFIPQEEPIEIVKYFETLRAFIPKDSLKKRANSERNTSSISVLNETKPLPLSELQKKRKFNTLENGFASSTPRPSRKRSKNSTETNLNIIPSEITSTSDQIGTKRKRDEKEVKTLETSSAEKKSEPFDDIPCKTDGKRDRSNRKKSNRKTESVGTASIERSSTQSQIVLNESSKHQSHHVFFNEAGEKVTTTTVDEKSQTNNEIGTKIDDISKSSTIELSYRSSLIESSGVIPPRILELQPTYCNISKEKTPKSPIEIREHVIISQPTANESILTTESIIQEDTEEQSRLTTLNESSLINKEHDNDIEINLSRNCSDFDSELVDELTKVIKETEEEKPAEVTENVEEIPEALYEDEFSYEEDSEVINLSDCSSPETFQNKNLSIAETTKLEDDGECYIDKILPLCTELEKLPSIGDIVLFKLLASDYKNYFAGACEYVNKRTKTMKLDILSGKSNIPKKFFTLLDVSLDQHKSITIKLSEMIETKVLVKST